MYIDMNCIVVRNGNNRFTILVFYSLHTGLTGKHDVLTRNVKTCKFYLPRPLSVIILNFELQCEINKEPCHLVILLYLFSAELHTCSVNVYLSSFRLRKIMM